MRAGTLLLLVSAACNTQIATSPDDPPSSVRERLEQSETRLLISAADSAGSITAHRRIAGDGWDTGLVDLGADNGEVVATADADGVITIERLEVSLASIPIPSSVFGHEAELTNIRAALAAPARVETTWVDADEASLTAVLELELSWALEVDGGTTPLGSPRIPPVEVEVSVTGNGEFVHAEVRATASGEVWNWADLIRLEDLHLILAAETP